MTKHWLNKILTPVLVAAFAFAAASPALAADRPKTAQANPGSEQTNKTFCQNLKKFQQNLDERITNQQEQLGAKIGDRTQKIKDFIADRQNALTEFRDNRDENRDQHYQKLLERAKTDAQKKAVNDFKIATNTALATRRAAVDAANRAFQEGIKTLWAERKTAIEAARKTFGAAVDAAKKQAEADCASGIAAKTIAEKYRAALKTARETLLNDTKIAPKIANSLNQLKETRKAAIQKAFNAFAGSLKTALAKLKADFGETKNNTPGSPTSTKTGE